MSVTQDQAFRSSRCTLQLQQLGMDENVAVHLAWKHDGLDHVSLLMMLAVWLRLWSELHAPLDYLGSNLW